MNEALRLKVDHDRRLRALGDFISAYEAERGEISEQEMRDAARSARARAVVVRGAGDGQRTTGVPFPRMPESKRSGPVNCALANDVGGWR